MKTIWKRIEKWLIENTPPGEEQVVFPAGASEAELQKADATMGLELPEDVRASYKCHNGTYNQICLWGDMALMPITPLRNDNKRRHTLRSVSVVEEWGLLKRYLEEGVFVGDDFVNDPSGPIKICWWNTKWVPLTDNQCGDYSCLDMDPAEGGKEGQIIDWGHEGGAGATVVLADSFRQWLSDYADNLEAGRYTFDGMQVSKKYE